MHLAWSGLTPTLAQAAAEERNFLQVIQDSLTSGLGDGCGEVVPKLIAAVGIFIVGGLVAYIAASVVRGLLR